MTKGGKRPGSGRKRKPAAQKKRAAGWTIAAWIIDAMRRLSVERQQPQSAMVEAALIRAYRLKKPAIVEEPSGDNQPPQPLEQDTKKT